MSNNTYTKANLNKYKIYGSIFRVVRKIVGVGNFKREKYGTRRILDAQNTNDYIFRKLINNEHFFVARLGDVECRLIETLCQNELGTIKNVPEKVFDIAKNNAGIFFNDKSEVNSFFQLYKKSLQELTGICVWFNYLEDFVVDSFAPNSELLSLLGLDSYLFSVPWTAGLKGKRVLVINPFSDTIQKQYQKRELIFPSNTDTLPEFDKLYTYKSEMTFAGEKPRFASWEQTLDYMYENCKNIDFDVAIIGCGGYGLPLGAKLYELGKSVVHCGGVTQVFFGIKGKRWEDLPYTARYMNEYWVRPNENEKPGNNSSVENGCYW